jgi:hypothetical protein
MNPILTSGLLIGVLCGIWTFVMGATGWYKDPVLHRAFFLVLIIEVAGLIWGLRRTAAEGRGYGSQVVAGATIATVAGLVVIGSSLLFTTVFFPDYFDQLEAANRAILEQRGLEPQEIARQLADMRAVNTPMNQASLGFSATLIFGILISAIAAIWIRAAHPVPGPAMRR